jgi:hypothetical protein
MGISSVLLGEHTHEERLELIDQLMKIRKNWKRRDFVDAYGDGEWEEIPESLEECFDGMEEYIYHTYDVDLIIDCIECEKDDDDDTGET